ncbi:HAD-superfamily subfamily IB hydrolase, TIGR01490 [Thioflavicoccus mobilis 8321]|uniref:Histidinol-phosphatase n=1 Tax=Thioflavicoccus mobilis 8321 TaxID=765912 RepID=L0GW84_9GAMM|nr:HAD family hydrolase [Thioflavicoccus mobilis]AGA90251.1 HAD-superfamily subfamily IB hydrolase, TIGR01490 [Thioflavicoccus mobilis 8321]
MPLAIFDLDNTLIAGDSDYLWGRFLVARGVVDGDEYDRLNERFYRDYREGRLDIMAFLRFALRPLRENDPTDLIAWRRAFIEEMIEPIILPAALDLVERHRRCGDELLIITATNAFVTAPIAARFGIPHLIATLPEQVEGRFTGEVAGIPSFREGKVARLEQWLAETGHDLAGSHFYSDSHNDLPLLERVAHPVAVDPDPTLAAEAYARGWPSLSLRPEVLA